MTLLTLRDLAVTYRTSAGRSPAVRGVDLTIGRGQRLGLAGESGCGKSTIALSLLRLLPAGTEITGQVRLNGADLLTMSWGALRAVRWASASIIFQGAQYALNPVRRIGGQIAEPIRLHQGGGRTAAHGRVLELLYAVGLDRSIVTRYPHELSGGQRQRVMIAMSLACSPELIIADEPTSALDLITQAQIMRLVRGLAAKHDTGLLMISHDLPLLAAACDTLAVMYAGRIVEEGPADQVFEHPAHPYSAGLADAVTRIGDPASRRNPHGLPGDPPDPALLPDGCAFLPRCPVAVGACATTDPRLRRVSAVQRAACVHVGDGGRPAQERA